MYYNVLYLLIPNYTRLHTHAFAHTHIYIYIFLIQDAQRTTSTIGQKRNRMGDGKAEKEELGRWRMIRMGGEVEGEKKVGESILFSSWFSWMDYVGGRRW
jgi:hypothetical protein